MRSFILGRHWISEPVKMPSIYSHTTLAALHSLNILMTINLNKPDRWKDDIKASVDLYNTWYFAPQTFRDERIRSSKQIEEALKSTDNLRKITPVLLKEHPEVLPMLRMATCPPIARDRLVELAGVSKTLVRCMEDRVYSGGLYKIEPKELARVTAQAVLDLID